VGFSQVSINDLSVGVRVADDDDMVFAYQPAAVFHLILTYTKLDLGYKYFSTSDPTFTDVAGVSFDAEYSSHNLTLGIMFAF
jgi:hypothetical protein